MLVRIVAPLLASNDDCNDLSEPRRNLWRRGVGLLQLASGERLRFLFLGHPAGEGPDARWIIVLLDRFGLGGKRAHKCEYLHR